MKPLKTKTLKTKMLKMKKLLVLNNLNTDPIASIDIWSCFPLQEDSSSWSELSPFD